MGSIPASRKRSVGRAVRRWISFVSSVVLWTALFYAWKVRGIAGAENIVLFMAGLMIVVGLLALFIKPRKHVPPRGPVLNACCWFSMVAVFIAMAWYGHPAIALFGLLGGISIEIFNAAASRLEPDVGEPESGGSKAA